MDYLEILNMITKAVLKTFPSSPYQHETILNAATQIYIEQMRINKDKDETSAKEINDVLDIITREIEAVLRGIDVKKALTSCDIERALICSFHEIKQIIDACRRSTNE